MDRLIYAAGSIGVQPRRERGRSEMTAGSIVGDKLGRPKVRVIDPHPRDSRADVAARGGHVAVEIPNLAEEKVPKWLGATTVGEDAIGNKVHHLRSSVHHDAEMRRRAGVHQRRLARDRDPSRARLQLDHHGTVAADGDRQPPVPFPEGADDNVASFHVRPQPGLDGDGARGLVHVGQRWGGYFAPALVVEH